MKYLQISERLSLPPAAVTQTFGILAMRGAGKTNLARVMAEEMHAASLPFVAVDPVGSWWGLRSSRDGKGAGINIPIFGGRHHDVPLERTGGALLADLVVDERLSCILDVSELSEGDKIRFLIDFAEKLYRRNQDPLHLFLEEADDYCPQRPFREQARLLRAWENIVRRGRSRGLGMTMITQRSAALNKNVLTQIETLFVLRTTSPQDRKAIAAWVEFHGQAKELLASLEGLKNGEAWVWSPSWLRKCERITSRLSWTFDSGATPKDIKGKRPPATLADVDLGAITKRMADTIERAKAEDPKELRKKIAELERQLRARPPAEEKKVEVPVVPPELLERFSMLPLTQWTSSGVVAALQETRASIGQALELMHNAKVLEEELLACLKRFENGRGGPSFPATRAVVRAQPAGQSHTARGAGAVGRHGGMVPGSRPAPGESSPLPLGERRVLIAIAQHRHSGVTRVQLSILTGYKRSSRDTYLQKLSSKGLVHLQGDLVLVSDEGLAQLGDDFEALPTGDALREHWLERLPEGEKRCFAVVVEAYPKGIDRVVVGDVTGYKRSSRDTYLQKLQARRLVVPIGRGEVRAAEELFS